MQLHVAANDPDHRPRATGARHTTETQSRGSVQSVCSASSFDPDTLSVDSIGADPAVNASAIVPNLESVALSGFNEVDILAAVDLAQDNITDLKVVRIRRNNGA
jgi:hypothetical protein